MRVPDPASMRWCCAAALAIALPAVAAGSGAGAIYGTVMRDALPLAGLVITVNCPGFEAAGGSLRASGNGVVDARGSYSVLIAPATRGRCQLRFTQNGRQGSPIDVFVSDSAQRLDLKVAADLGAVVVRR